MVIDFGFFICYTSKERIALRDRISMLGSGHSLERIIDGAVQLKQVRKEELQFGDLVLITTRNSDYSISVLDDDRYIVSGGWFARKGRSPMKVAITGCTWGGSIIKVDTLAACGLRMEFSNRVITTTIRKVRVIRGGSKN
jgi:hypothetical protein